MYNKPYNFNWKCSPLLIKHTSNCYILLVVMFKRYRYLQKLSFGSNMDKFVSYLSFSLPSFRICHFASPVPLTWTVSGCYDSPMSVGTWCMGTYCTAIFRFLPSMSTSVPPGQLKDGGLFFCMAAWKCKKLCARTKYQARLLAGNLLAWRMLQIKSRGYF